jgi:hypothetical protein
MENKKWVVKVINIFCNLIEMDAVNEDEAREKVSELIQNNKDGSEFEHLYEATLSPKNWSVISMEDFRKIEESFKKETEEGNIITPSIITP